MNIKLSSQDWVDGGMDWKYFEGYWIVGEKMKLSESSIKEVTDPSFEWLFDLEE